MAISHRVRVEPCSVRGGHRRRARSAREQREVRSVADLLVTGWTRVQAILLCPHRIGLLQVGRRRAVGDGGFEVDVTVEGAALDIGVDLLAPSPDGSSRAASDARGSFLRSSRVKRPSRENQATFSLEMGKAPMGKRPASTGACSALTRTRPVASKLA